MWGSNQIPHDTGLSLTLRTTPHRKIGEGKKGRRVCSGVTTIGAGRAVAPPLFDGSKLKLTIK